MTGVHVAVGGATIVLNLVAGAWGAWAWYRVVPASGFWPLLRLGQGCAVLQAAIGGVLYLAGHRGDDDLHVLYGTLPIAVMFIAEQLRVASAEAVLELRGLPDAQAVGGLPEAEQRSVVVQIVRRETGIMAASALVIVALAVRAATTG
jgi:hypothetical protein